MKRGSYKEGDIFQTKRCGELVITKIVSGPEVYVRFLNTGYERVTSAQNINSGLVADPFARLIAGVGFMGVGEHTSRFKTSEVGRGPKTQCTRYGKAL